MLSREERVTWFPQAVALSAQGQHEQALACYDRILDRDPAYVEAWINKGSSLISLERHAEALVCFDRAIELNRGISQAWFNKGIALWKGPKEYQPALRCFEEAHRLGNPAAMQVITHLRQQLDGQL
jgi:tetratricopeptide (TPR) repeat protein